VALHTYASLRAAERGDLPLDVELGAFRWLAARYSIAVTSRLVEQLDVARIRRLDLQVALESEQALDPPAAAAARNARRLRQCINSVERQIVVTDPGLPEIDRLRGALAGLLAVSGTGPVPAASDDTTSESYRGGRFGGELLASLIQGDMMPSETLRSICYRYGAALATPSGGTLLAEAPPTNALKAHTLGIHVLQQGVAAAPLDEELELALLTWLAARLEVPLTPDLVEHRKRFVARPKTPG
jgi:hypothetical protein